MSLSAEKKVTGHMSYMSFYGTTESTHTTEQDQTTVAQNLQPGRKVCAFKVTIKLTQLINQGKWLSTYA